jgi:hypothetical protein
MKLSSLVKQLAATSATPGATPRRALLQQLGRAGMQAAAAALPLNLATSLSAAADTTSTFSDALLQLVHIERLQYALYTRALAAPGLIPASAQADFQRLQRQQQQHLNFLLPVLSNSSVPVPPVPNFDFSGQRNVASNPVLFPNVLTSYSAFLELAQQLEDVGVRAYKTQLPLLGTDRPLLTATLRMHSVEARHSAHVRGLRRAAGATVKNWPSDTDAAISRPAAAAALTTAANSGEASAVQLVTGPAQIPFASLLITRDNTAIRETSLSEAFDEPTTRAIVQAALDLFS